MIPAAAFESVLTYTLRDYFPIRIPEPMAQVFLLILEKFSTRVVGSDRSCGAGRGGCFVPTEQTFDPPHVAERAHPKMNRLICLSRMTSTMPASKLPKPITARFIVPLPVRASTRGAAAAEAVGRR